MSPESAVALGVSVSGLVVAVYSAWRNKQKDEIAVLERVAQMEVKVDTLWEYQVTRAKTEALVKGAMTENSPLVVSPHAREVYDHSGLTKALQKFYKEEGSSMNDVDLFIAIYKRFKEEIVRKACVPLRLHNGACFLIAVKLAQEAPVTSPSLRLDTARARQQESYKPA